MLPTETQVRLAVVAPARAMRVGLIAMLSADANLRVAAEAAGLEDLPVDETGLDVVLMSGLEFGQLTPGRGWLASEEAPALVLMTAEPLTPPLPEWLRLRPWSVISVDSTPEELILAVRAAAAGFWLADPGLTSSLLTTPIVSLLPDAGEGLEALTTREIEVLQQLAQGLANKQIAAALHVSENTVKFHISGIYAKLGAGNRAEAVRLGVRLGYITI